MALHALDTLHLVMTVTYQTLQGP